MTTETNSYLDPRQNPNKWLCNFLIECIDDCPEEGAKVLLREAIWILTHWVEPGVIDQAFEPWIEEYVAAMESTESNQDTVPAECSVKDPWE